MADSAVHMERLEATSRRFGYITLPATLSTDVLDTLDAFADAAPALAAEAFTIEVLGDLVVVDLMDDRTFPLEVRSR
ncbi:hypothetical protein [Curtobacterium sp. MCBD17_040]|uniref:hypothetical protein n=1 Tax=Curtobacterium sp. MCBD17_040 TaxID=2175674 RepID=UPI000DA982EF|nr:hypothetical protein [Curtobacterium sp. MCBD17_040]WIB65370.1 hypothetical protein DEI94_18355 [Curtobacterium sp. MCBD17_040]